jgi:hypothetical protein
MFLKNQQQKKVQKTLSKPIRVNMSNPWPGHDTEVTPSKANLIKLWSSMTKQSDVEGQNRIKIFFKKCKKKKE